MVFNKKTIVDGGGYSCSCFVPLPSPSGNLWMLFLDPCMGQQGFIKRQSFVSIFYSFPLFYHAVNTSQRASWGAWTWQAETISGELVNIVTGSFLLPVVQLHKNIACAGLRHFAPGEQRFKPLISCINNWPYWPWNYTVIYFFLVSKSFTRPSMPSCIKLLCIQHIKWESDNFTMV